MGRPDVVVVGAAARDVAADDPRGWRLGGGVTYGGLTLARLGLSAGVVVGLDPAATAAPELDLLEAAGAEVVRVPLEHGPVFDNQERPSGRVQTCLSVSDHVVPASLPPAWRDAPAWLLAPVAAELPDSWADVPRPGACVALGWQGLLRHLAVGERVRPLHPAPSALLARADVVGVSRHDLPHELDLGEVAGWLGPEAEVLLTAGPLGGLLLRARHGRLVGGRRYPAVRAREELDPTGAGDTILAGLLAARVGAGREWPVGPPGRDLLVGALAASLLVEGAGLASAPWLAVVRQRAAALLG
jgi:sugar/nucleoside kinase (ribokinase family)